MLQTHDPYGEESHVSVDWTKVEKYNVFDEHSQQEKSSKVRVPNTNGENNIGPIFYIFRTLLHINHNERPTCEQVLKILNSEKSIDEIKTVIQQNRRVTNQEWRAFERVLKSTSAQNEELASLFLATAVKVLYTQLSELVAFNPTKI